MVKANIEVRYALPKQDADLPKRLESHIETAGQQIKRELFRGSLQRAALELVSQKRFQKRKCRLHRNGTNAHTFKTIFGTVAVPQIRLRPSTNGDRICPQQQLGIPLAKSHSPKACGMTSVTYCSIKPPIKLLRILRRVRGSQILKFTSWAAYTK